MDRWIVMGRDECNDEFRPSNNSWPSQDEAYTELSSSREIFVEARSMWVEMLKDKSFYLKNRDYDYPDDDYGY